MSNAGVPSKGFDGTVRLFPLPNVVMFPYVIQPLHIFEPRYREMMADALAGNRMLAPVLLRPGWEEQYHLRPAVHEVACLGRITSEERLADGRYNLLLHGLGRVRLLEEVADDRPFRVARVELLYDRIPSADEEDELRDELCRRTPAWFNSPGALEQTRELFDGDLSLTAIGDIFSFILPLEVEFKQELLAELDVAVRVRRLLARLKEHPPAERRFPPEFSCN